MPNETLVFRQLSVRSSEVFSRLFPQRHAVSGHDKGNQDSFHHRARARARAFSESCFFKL